MNLSIRNSNYHITTWAVVAGTVVALSVEVVLNFLGIGLGLTNMNLTLNSLFKTGIGAVIWLAVSGCISMAVGGWVAGKLSEANNTKGRIMHGFLAWSFATLITVIATTSAAGAIIGGPTSVIGGGMSSRVSQNAVSNSGATSGSENSSGNQGTAEAAGEGIGGAAIAMFMAFLLSAAASMVAAAMAKSKEDGTSDGQVGRKAI